MVNATRQVARDQRDSSAVTESEQDVIRSLGSLEHLFWLLDQRHFVHFAVTVLISGETSPCDWRRALDRLQKRHPILSVCIDGEPDSAPLFRQAGAAPIPLRILEEEPELRWEAEVEKELATPFNPSRAPLIRAVLIQGARDAAFMLVAHHSIADGLSLAYAIRDTLDALAGRSLLPLPWLPSQDDVMNVSDSLMDGQEQDQAGAAMPAIYRPHDNARPTVKALRLSPGLTSSVRNRARQEGTTVHGALCAALVLASREVFAAWREIPLRILSPINARPLLDADESCGVFLGAPTSVFDKQAIDFWDIARDARIDVAANKTTEKIAAQLSEFRRVVGNGADVATVAEFVAKVFASEVLLTNLGSLSFDRQFGPVTLKAMFGPAVLTGFEGHQTIGVATVNGALCLLHTSHTPPQGLLEKTQSVQGAQATATNAVAIGAGSVASAPNTVSVGSPGNERRITNVAPGIAPTDAATFGQLTSVATGIQSQINNVDRRLRDGVAVSMAAGGVPAVPQGRRVGVFGNIATYDGHGAAGVGLTGVLYETRGYQVQANGAVGVGFDTSVVGARGGIGVFW